MTYNDSAGMTLVTPASRCQSRVRINMESQLVALGTSWVEQVLIAF